MKTRKIIHIVHCIVLYAIIFYLSLFSLTYVYPPPFCFDAELGERCLFPSDLQLVILREDVEKVNEKLKDAFSEKDTFPKNVVYVTYDNKRIKTIYLGNFFSCPGDNDVKKVNEIIDGWLNELARKQGKRGE